MLKRESVEGKFYLQGVDAYVTFRKGEDGKTNYTLDTGDQGELPLITRVQVKEAMSKLFAHPVQPIFMPVQ